MRKGCSRAKWASIESSRGALSNDVHFEGVAWVPNRHGCDLWAPGIAEQGVFHSEGLKKIDRLHKMDLGLEMVES